MAADGEVRAGGKWKALAQRDPTAEMTVTERIIQEELARSRLGFSGLKSQVGAMSTDAAKEHKRRLRADQERIAMFKEGLRTANQLTEKMVRMLDEVDARLENVESRIRPLHEVTNELQAQDKNLQDAIKQAEMYLRYFHTPRRLREMVEEVARLERYRPHIEAINELEGALDFIYENRQFKGAAAVQAALEERLQRAVDRLNALMEMLIHQHARQPKHPRLYKQEDDIGPGLIPLSVVAVLEEISPVISKHADRLGFVREFQEKRSVFLFESMKLITGTDEFIEGMKQRRRVYRKGNHPFLEVVDLFLLMLQSERDLTERVVPPHDFDAVFSSVVKDVLVHVVQLGEQATPVKHADLSEIVLVTFDILSHLEAHLTDYLKVLKSQDGTRDLRRDIVTYIEGLIDIVKSWSSNFERSVLSHDTKAKTVDGNVHQHTANTVAYLESLLDYRELVEIRLPKPTWRADDDSRSKQTAMGLFVSKVLSALMQNISDKAKNYKSNSLKAVFLLNNYHFIMSKVTNTGLRTVVDAALVQRLNENIAAQRAAYMECWNGCLLNLLERNQALRTDVLSKADKKALKDRFGGFNEEFAKVHAEQEKFAIYDRALRDSIREDNKSRIVPLFTDFFNRYHDSGFTQNEGKYFRYHPETVGEMIDRFFGGSAAS